MRTVLAAAAVAALSAGCGGAEQTEQPASPVPEPLPSSVQQLPVTDFALPAGVKELTPVVRQDSPEVYRLAFKGMKPGTLYVWIECDGDGPAPVIVAEEDLFTTECGSPGLSGYTVEQPEGLPAFEVAVGKGLNVREVRLLVGRRA